MSTHAVEIRVNAPERYDRVQLLLRFAILVVIGIAGASLGWVGWALYLTLPLVAAVGVSTRGSIGYLGEIGPPVGRFLRWVVTFYGYMMLVVDRFPTRHDETELEMTIQPGGVPTVGTALLRWITSAPSAIVFVLLGIIAGLLAFLAAVWILLTGDEPTSILRFQAGMVRWNARLLAYHASLVDEYPPFTLSEGAGDELRREHAPAAA